MPAGYGKSWKLENTDICFDSNGAVEWVEGALNAAQGIMVLYQTARGEDLNVKIGFPYLEIFNADLNYDSKNEYVEGEVMNTGFMDDRVKNITDITKTYVNRLLSLDFKVVLLGEEAISMKMGVEL